MSRDPRIRGNVKDLKIKRYFLNVSRILTMQRLELPLSVSLFDVFPFSGVDTM